MCDNYVITLTQAMSQPCRLLPGTSSALEFVHVLRCYDSTTVTWQRAFTISSTYRWRVPLRALSESARMRQLHMRTTAPTMVLTGQNASGVCSMGRRL